MPADDRAVSAANQAFYQAFESADLDAMSDLWEHSDRVSCAHPGWTLLRGWASVAASWAALFQSPERLQFILTNEQVVVEGNAGWVTVDENIIGAEAATVTSINLFVRSGTRWQMVGHHGSVVASRQDPREG